MADEVKLIEINTGGAMYVATETFVTKWEGADILITADHTRVSEGHGLIRAYPHLFKPITAHYEVEQATKAPGERRGV